jgi:hypothetical protein
MRRAPAGVTIALALALTAATTGIASAQNRTQRLRLGVPAYWSPGTPQGAEGFRRLAHGVPTVDVVVVNGPASAAPAPFDPATATTIRDLRRAGVTVLGYVDSGYLGRTGMTTTRANAGSTEVADWVTQIRGDVADWYDVYGWYGLGGVFIDQTLSSCGDDDAYVDAYRDALYDARRGNRGASVVLNPGTGADECYADVADVLVVFENTYEVYRGWTPPGWVRDRPAERFWHLVYDAPTTDALSDAVGLAGRRHAGLVYVTDHPWSATRSQWDMLPTYWSDELALLGG